MTTIIEIKTNGYNADELQKMIGMFDKAAAILFPGSAVHHFYYGDSLDMIDVVLGSGSYARFNLTANRVSLCGYSCSIEELERFVSMTHNDEIFNGRLIEIAG